MRNSKLTTITDALLLTVAFIMFIDSVLEMKDTVLVKKKLFKKVFRHDNLGPIEDIKVGRNMCDEDAGYTSFFNFTFQGVKRGSYSSNTGTFSDSSCEADDINCVDIPEIKSQYLSVFADKVLCLKRMQLTTDNHLSLAKGLQCTSGYKQCGLYNNFEDKFCVKNNLPCPINYIAFKETKDIDFKNITYKYEEMQNGFWIVSSNNMTDEKLAIDFEVAENYPCLEYERISVNGTFPPYPRMNNLDLFGCNAGDYKDPSLIIDDGFDKRYEVLSEYAKFSFLYDNDLIRKYDSLPEVAGWKSDLVDNNVKLYKRAYISANLTCTSNEAFNIFHDNVEKLKVLKYVQMVSCLCNVVILCFFISLLSLVKILKQWFHVILNVVKILISSAFVAYSITQSYHSFQLTKSTNEYMKLLQTDCTDKFTDAAIMRYDVDGNIKRINCLNQYLYFFSISYGVVTFIQFIRLCYKIYIRIKNRNRRRDAVKQLGPMLFENKKNQDTSEPLMNEKKD